MFFVQFPGSLSTLGTVTLPVCWLLEDSSRGEEGLGSTQMMKTQTQKSTERPRPSKDGHVSPETKINIDIYSIDLNWLVPLRKAAPVGVSVLFLLRINPVTGVVEEEQPDPMEGMTEEQKEYEAIKLIKMFEKLSRLVRTQAVTNPRLDYQS